MRGEKREFFKAHPIFDLVTYVAKGAKGMAHMGVIPVK